MPRFNLTDGEANELTDYIMTVYQSPSVDRDSMPLSGYRKARLSWASSFSTASMPARVATCGHQERQRLHRPNLDASRFALTAAWIFAWMKNPQACVRAPGSQPRHERRGCPRLTAFLISQKGGGKSEVAKK